MATGKDKSKGSDTKVVRAKSKKKIVTKPKKTQSINVVKIPNDQRVLTAEGWLRRMSRLIRER